ncbi:MAG: DUF4097 family beta strand repeat protein [Ruminococcus sp.]|nr:DUF4097 family beta strand repeat protein [Ruminococcus sp.]
MKKIIASSVICALALSSCSFSINGEKLDFDTKESKSETVSIKPEKAVKLDIDIKVGQIDIRYGDTKNVEVIGSYTSKGASADKVSAALENVRLESKIKGDTLYITMSERDFDTRFVNVTTDLDITLPSEFSDYTIKTDVGDINLENLKGSFDITADVGNVSLESLVGDFSISANVGNIECENISVKDDSKITADVGDIDVSVESVAECELEITADVGDIDVDTLGLDFTEKEQSEDFVGKKKEIVIENKCTVKLSADVGNVKAAK